VRLLLVGDVVGKPGRHIVGSCVKGLVRERQLDLVVVNAENAAGGSGITPAIFSELLAAGVDGVTLGDHIYRRQEFFSTLDSNERVVRPANFPPNAPGREWMSLTARDGTPVIVISLLGRIFMRPVDCPYRAVDRVLSEVAGQAKVILVDFHAEATGDMQSMGRYLDGRVSAVLGTHTHVPTADECIFPGGTAFQCDVGMTGPHESILGRRIDRVLETTLSFTPTHFEVAQGDNRLCGTIVDVDPATGRATAIERLRVDEAEAIRLSKL
jgi:metallophosphoesterase (TIGR00282 family)